MPVQICISSYSLTTTSSFNLTSHRCIFHRADPHLSWTAISGSDLALHSVSRHASSPGPGKQQALSLNIRNQDKPRQSKHFRDGSPRPHHRNHQPPPDLKVLNSETNNRPHTAQSYCSLRQPSCPPINPKK